MLSSLVSSLIILAVAPQADTPQTFQRLYLDAVNSQNADAIWGLFLIRTPGEAAMVDVIVANELDNAKITTAAERIFGVKLVGGGTMVPPVETDRWKVEADIANIPLRGGQRNPNCASLRKTDAGYKIDLVAWGMNWMDTPEAPEARKRHRWDPGRAQRTVKAISEGRYRSMDEFREVGPERPFLTAAPGSPIGNKPRGFRRPVKVDLSTPLAARRTILLATAEGDGNAFLQCVNIVDPADEPTIKIQARHITSFASLQEAAEKAFDLHGEGFAIPAPLPDPRTGALTGLDELDDLEHRPRTPDEHEPLVVNGDFAKWMEMGDVTAEMNRINGQWKLNSRLREQIGQKSDDPNDWVAIYTMLVKVEEDMTRRLGAKEFRSLADARAAAKLAAEQTTEHAAPTTRPAGN